MQRWIWRSEIYSRINEVAKQGCEVVNSSFFAELEYEVIKELTKNLRSSVKKKPKTII